MAKLSITHRGQKRVGGNEDILALPSLLPCKVCSTCTTCARYRWISVRKICDCSCPYLELGLDTFTPLDRTHLVFLKMLADLINCLPGQYFQRKWICFSLRMTDHYMDIIEAKGYPQLCEPCPVLMRKQRRKASVTQLYPAHCRLQSTHTSSKRILFSLREGGGEE